jgi:hypothetical protein
VRPVVCRHPNASTHTPTTINCSLTCLRFDVLLAIQNEELFARNAPRRDDDERHCQRQRTHAHSPRTVVLVHMPLATLHAYRVHESGATGHAGWPMHLRAIDAATSHTSLTVHGSPSSHDSGWYWQLAQHLWSSLHCSAGPSITAYDHSPRLTTTYNSAATAARWRTCTCTTWGRPDRR